MLLHYIFDFYHIVYRRVVRPVPADEVRSVLDVRQLLRRLPPEALLRHPPRLLLTPRRSHPLLDAEVRVDAKLR